VKPGKFVTFEGIEGAGKSSNLKQAVLLLESAGVPVVVTREPGGTSLAEEIRQILLQPRNEQIAADSELLLIFAARAQHLEEIIRPALARGDWVLCDRFTDATYAYQGGGRGIDTRAIATLEALVQRGLVPDCTLLFDIPVQQGLERADKRGQLDRFEIEASTFFERVRETYLKRSRAEPARFRLIDAGLPLAKVTEQVSQVISDLIEDSRQ